MVKLSDFFSSLFGPPGPETLGPDELPRNIQEEFEQKFNGRPINEGFPEQSWPFVGVESYDQDVHEQLDSLEKRLFRDAEDMFNNFFSGLNFGFQLHDQDPGSMGAPPDSLPDDHSLGSLPPHSRTLRDKMLQDPKQESSGETEFGSFWRFPFGHESQIKPRHGMDRDLDSAVEEGTQSLDDIITLKEKTRPFGFKSPHSLSSSFSSVTIVDSNGVTEKRVTRRDSGGNEEETVMRQIGDQSYTVTRRQDGSGNEETKEDLVNIEHGEQDKFDEKWSQSRSRVPVQSFPGPLSSVLDSIMEQFFPRGPR